ncbi:MAG: DUF4007 family protein [Verrucomicrobia bacterium]|nr:DUF4007 family protein [Verrucomicrobiota bacterium]MCH8510351.1 DUF4007 family protein [Kiritimatiellia bacterium]
MTRKLKFSGHQTFCCRYGWLEKGYSFVKRSKTFTDEDAIVDLGVGKNMVASIKYWCEMAQVIENNQTTTFGDKLLDEENGWDPFLEDLASWWLLHWKIITNPICLTAGSVMFTQIRKPEFSKADLLESSLRSFDPNKKTPSDSILMRDIDCYIRTYLSSQNDRLSKKHGEAFECPFQELNLIQRMSEGEIYRFSIGTKLSIPAQLIGYVIADYFGERRNAMVLQKLLYAPFSPGQIYMLDENALIEALQTLMEHKEWGEAFGFTESAGIAQVYCELSSNDALKLLENYYQGDF